MASPAYDKAAQTLLTLTDLVVRRERSSPRALARAAGLPPSSGYRALATLEAAGLLSRDLDGALVRGVGAYRMGLAAYGLGRFADGVDPVLDQLRREVRRTAFLGILQEGQLYFGPFHLSRGAAYIVPPSDDAYNVEVLDRASGVCRVSLLPISEDETNTPLPALLTPIGAGNAGAEATLGVLLGREPSNALPMLHQAMSSAALRLQAMAGETGKGPPSSARRAS